ncbi:redoxin domain-containing protein, partial [Burkholderia sp. Ac-20344]|uniref:thioredoxin family protein n=1 Tax=Burkholderia sp. Ac-20344 TaxID=2703890 RepID=UPI00197BC9D5
SAALRGASVGTTLLLVAYAAGAATSLGVALVIGGKVFAAMKRSLGAGEWIKRGIGVALLAGVGAIALGLDTGALAQLSTVTTGGFETKLIDRLGGRSNGAPAATAATANATDNTSGGAMMAASADGAQAGGGAMAGSAMMRAADATPAALPVEGTLPSLDGAVQWLNSPPLTAAGLRGKVVLVDFWTYSCINCLRTLPYTTAWARKYAPYGLVVIGVHAPEFAFERDIGNVKKAVHDLGIGYPVAIDNGYSIWRAFGNEYWPAHYFIDAQGRIRHHHFGEGEYAQSERAIQSLLAEAGHPEALNVPIGLTGAPAKGALAAADTADVRSPETYVGYARAESFTSPGGVVRDAAHRYDAPAHPDLNDWGLAGTWQIGAERASLAAPSGRIVYRFHARDLHLVLGPGANGQPVRFRVTLDGAAPGAAHGSDVDAQGYGTVTAQRLYQLVRQDGAIADRTFAIEFLDPGVNAYAFTFG